jgi:sugar-specific transcriptional regulator TrmB
MNIQTILKNFGLNDKEISVYLALIDLGPSPVRLVAQKSKVNRGTAYDILKALQKQGLVSFYDTQAKQHFVAEPPEKLLAAVKDRQEELEEVKQQIHNSLPELKTIFEKQGGKPIVKSYEGSKGIRFILEDVIASAKKGDMSYYAYSSSDVKNELYRDYKDFNKDRLRAKISNKIIAFGKGGELVGLDERKWMNAEHGTPTYILIYSGKVAMISLATSGQPVGVIIEDAGLYQTQKMIFEFNWKML